jgi:hypothetical protein
MWSLSAQLPGDLSSGRGNLSMQYWLSWERFSAIH